MKEATELAPDGLVYSFAPLVACGDQLLSKRPGGGPGRVRAKVKPALLREEIAGEELPRVDIDQ